MELVEGQPLSALIGAGRDLDPAAVRDLLAQVGDALGAAHRAGIIHRDVKPANLIVTPAGKVKVTDFGIARAADGVGITRTGAVMGTPQYLSPEQAEGRPATAASDVYALGVVAFECLAGRRPFDAESPVATALAHIREPVPDLPTGVPDDLAAVVTRALSKDPADRYPDGAAFAAALRDPATAAVQRPPVVAPVVPPDTRTQVLAATPTRARRRRRSPRPRPRPTSTTTPQQPVAARGRRLSSWRSRSWSPCCSPATTTDSAGGRHPSSTRPRRPAPNPDDATHARPGTVSVNEGCYLGQQVDDVEADLRGLGLEVQRNGQGQRRPAASTAWSPPSRRA